MTNESSKTSTTQSMLEATSVCGMIAAIVNSPTINLVRFASDYKAENAGNAQAASALGESGRGKGQGVGHKLSKKLTGLAFNAKGGKLTVILTLLDMTHRQSSKQGGFAPAGDRSFEFASRTVADITDPSRRLDWIEVCDDFSGWRRISLAHLPIFDSPQVSEESAFAAVLLDKIRLGVKVSKLASKVTAIKAKVRKAKGDMVKAEDGSVAIYLPPTGESVTIVDSDGNKVKSESRKVKNRGLLFADVGQIDADYFPAEWIQIGGRYDGRLSSNVEFLPVYMAALETARSEYEKVNALVRPLECGVIERNMIDGELTTQLVTLGSTEFEIHINEDTEYDLPSDCAAKILTGEYKEIRVPASKGSWTLEPAKATAKAN